MIVEILPRIGLAPIVLDAAQIVVRADDGTPILVAAHYGTDRSLAIASIAFDPDEFNRVLRQLGIPGTVIVAGEIRSPNPEAGAQLLLSPNSK